MKNLAFVFWLIFFPFFETLSQYLESKFLPKEQCFTKDDKNCIRFFFIFYFLIAALLYEL